MTNSQWGQDPHHNTYGSQNAGNFQNQYGQPQYGSEPYGPNQNQTAQPQYQAGNGQVHFPVADWDQPAMQYQQGESEKSYVIATVLAGLLGQFGADRFYLGKIGTAVAKLLTLGGLGIWSFIDFVMTLFGAARDKSGRKLKGFEQYKKLMWTIAAIWVVLSLIVNLVTGVFIIRSVMSNQRVIDPPAPIPTAPGGPTADPSTGTQGGASFTDWANDLFGTFEEAEHTGSGSGVFNVPADVNAAYLEVEYSGDGYLTVSGLDASNQTAGSGSLFLEGKQSAGAVFELANDYSEPVTRIKVDGRGDWKIVLKPVADIPPFTESGSGYSVMQYNEGPADFEIKYEGESNFIVHQYTESSDYPNLLVNEIDSWSGTVPVVAGPGYISVKSSGDWTFTRK